MRKTDSSPGTTCSVSSLGWYNSYGGCGGTGSSNNSKKMRTSSLTIGNSNTASKNSIISINNNWKDYPLQSLHKVWGDDGGKFNNGVNGNNVYISGNIENIIYSIPSSKKLISKNTKQNVVIMEAHGDKYKGPVPGLRSGKNKTNVMLLQMTHQDNVLEE